MKPEHRRGQRRADLIKDMSADALTLWRGEQDLHDGGTLLFDRSAGQYLPGLLAELAWLTVWRLRNILDLETRWGYHNVQAGDRGGGAAGSI